MVAMLGSTEIEGKKINDLVQEGKISKEKLFQIVDRTKKGGAEIVKYLEKGSAFYAPAASGVEMAESYLKDLKKQLPCAVYLNGEYGAKDIYAGVPVIIGSGGVEKIVEIELSSEERSNFEKSIDAVKDLFNTGENVGFFMMSAYDNVDVVKVEKEVKTVLKDIKDINPKDEEAIGGFNLGKVFKDTANFVDGLSFLSLVVGIATILAGVIGIGNILLISVKERTKEIGIRRALGATPRQIRNQIITESVFLTILSGIIGIILGTLVLYGINVATEDLSDFPYTNPTVPLKFIFGALTLMIILGTLIGTLPAQKAVSIKPIDALREE